MVEHRRFELLTPTLPVLCATNCANAPSAKSIIAQNRQFVKRFFSNFIILFSGLIVFCLTGENHAVRRGGFGAGSRRMQGKAGCAGATGCGDCSCQSRFSPTRRGCRGIAVRHRQAEKPSMAAWKRGPQAAFRLAGARPSALQPNTTRLPRHSGPAPASREAFDGCMEKRPASGIQIGRCPAQRASAQHDAAAAA